MTINQKSAYRVIYIWAKTKVNLCSAKVKYRDNEGLAKSVNHLVSTFGVSDSEDSDSGNESVDLANNNQMKNGRRPRCNWFYLRWCNDILQSLRGIYCSHRTRCSDFQLPGCRDIDAEPSPLRGDTGQQETELAGTTSKDVGGDARFQCLYQCRYYDLEV